MSTGSSCKPDFYALCAELPIVKFESDWMPWPRYLVTIDVYLLCKTSSVTSPSNSSSYDGSSRDGTDMMLFLGQDLDNDTTRLASSTQHDNGTTLGTCMYGVEVHVVPSRCIVKNWQALCTAAHTWVWTKVEHRLGKRVSNTSRRSIVIISWWFLFANHKHIKYEYFRSKSYSYVFSFSGLGLRPIKEYMYCENTSATYTCDRKDYITATDFAPEVGLSSSP